MFRKNYQEVELLDKQHLLEKYIVDVSKDFKCENPEYDIVKTSYKYVGEKSVWNSSLISIFKNGELLNEFVRNYPSFSLIYIKQNEKEFLVTSGDYQCITIVNLTDNVIKSYVDIDDVKHGCGFCPISFDWDEDTLYVEGCIWACPYETMVCRDIDLENPIESFNQAEWLDEDGYYEDEEEDDEWDDDDSDCQCE